MPKLLTSNILILFADLQDSIVGHGSTNPEGVIRKSAGALAAFARDLRIPAIASVVPFGTDDPQPIREIKADLPDIRTYPRAGPAIFAHAETRDAILTSGRRTLAIAGVASEVVILHAALAAREFGLNVHVLLDAGGGFSARTEDAAIREMEKAGAVTSSVASFTTRLADEFSSPEGQAVMGALQALMS